MSRNAIAKIVEQKAANLKQLSYEQLVDLPSGTEPIMAGERPGTVSVIVERLDGLSRLKVVVQGFSESDGMPWRQLGFKDVAVEGFYIRRDNVVTQMRPDELYEYD